MAREVSKKKKKTSSSKSTASPQNKSSGTQVGVNHDLIAIIIIALGIWLAVSMIFTETTGILGSATKSLFLGLFGSITYTWCGVMIFCALHYIVTKNIKKYKKKYIMTAFLLVFIGALWHLIDDVQINGAVIGTLWDEGNKVIGGGLTGGIIGYFAESIAGNTGSYVIISTIIFMLFICI